MRGPRRGEVIARAAVRLAGAGVPEPGRDARRLYRWAARLDGAGLAAALADPARPAELARFDRAVGERLNRVPVSQITGRRAFWGREFEVTADVLDPRPETETLIAAALDGPPVGRVVDLGTGSGCLLVTLLAEWPQATGLGTDISAAALVVASRNAERLGVAARATLRRGDWFAAVDGRFDLIVANPPYIAGHEIAGLAPEVRDHEPHLALTPGGDGLAAYRAIAAGLRGALAPGGRLLAEIGDGQGPAVTEIFARHGFAAGILDDFDGRPRCIRVTA